MFISVYNKLGELHQEMKFENWVFSIAKNTYRNEMERRGARKRAATPVSIGGDWSDPQDLRLSATPGATPETELLEKEKLEALRDALQGLPRQMRSCLFLRVDDELSYREIAAVMGIAVNTVSAHLHQARSVLKEKLGQYFGEIQV